MVSIRSSFSLSNQTFQPQVLILKVFAQLMGKAVAADDVFVCIGLYGLVQFSTSTLLPVAITFYAEGISSIQRIQAINNLALLSFLFVLFVYRTSYVTRS